MQFPSDPYYKSNEVVFMLLYASMEVSVDAFKRDQLISALQRKFQCQNCVKQAAGQKGFLKAKNRNELKLKFKVRKKKNKIFPKDPKLFSKCEEKDF